MAMLAEPRRKQKVINLRAKNNAWSSDSNKFGQRMLEKMGWSSGKGLGANENGIVEHVVARYKNDDRGLGFEDRNDQWTKHEDDFNALLANLSNGDDKELQSHSGVSLEVKSKKSKARVHFHKFTRAKDLSRYSEKDLANIFGKKTLKCKEKREEKLNDDIKTTEQVFTEKGSMEDYFKNKLLALNSKNKVPSPVTNDGYDDDADCGFKGFSGTTNEDEETENTCLGFGFQPLSDSDELKKESADQNVSENYSNSVESRECTKKNKKKKKSKQTNNNDNGTPNVEKNETLNESDNCIPYDYLDEVITKKNKKPKQEKVQENDPASQETVETASKKKKNKKKLSLNQELSYENEDDYVPKKKKKKNKELQK